MGDIAGAYAAGGINNGLAGTKIKTTNPSAGNANLDMMDFLKLIVLQFQNQDPENAASSTDMMNQMVQMSVVQAITNITDAATMLYTSSLVGKEVTIGQYNKDNKLEEIVGVVTGTGTYNGQQVVFVNDESYYLSDIMAIGRLPEKEEPPEEPDDSGDSEGKGDQSGENPAPGV